VEEAEECEALGIYLIIVAMVVTFGNGEEYIRLMKKR
jgi:hypothetical protein